MRVVDYLQMAAGNKVVVDGSNIATEGRSSPSLAQLDEAVRAYLAEHPNADVTVVVDATFGHRIEDSERQLFEEARAAGEMVSPPAGAIGRGDAFLLRIAEKTGATVLSNDSFQEFHGEHEWLFTTGRLVGGVPVSGVGWIFTPRSPVRGPKSRQSVQEAKRDQKRSTPRAEPKQKAIKEATEEATEPEAASRRRRRRRGKGAPSEPLNDPLPFLTFVSAHPLGTELEGEVEEFSSHGAFVQAGDVRCYVPLSALGDPPPRAAREVLNRGQQRTFVVQALDPLRRGIELALPGHAHVSGTPTSETVEAEIKEAQVVKSRSRSRATSGGRRKAGAVLSADRPADAGPEDELAPVRAEPASADPARQSAKFAEKVVRGAPPPEVEPPKSAMPRKKVAVKKAKAASGFAGGPKRQPAAVTATEPAKVASRNVPTKKVAAKRLKKKAAKASVNKPKPKKAATKKATPRKAGSRTSTAKSTTARRAGKKAGAKKTAAKTTARKSTAKRPAARATPAKKSAKKATSRKATAKKSSAKKSSQKKATTKRTGATKKAARSRR